MIIQSILDTDLYKLTMMMAVSQHFPNTWVRYEFTNRGGTKFSKEFTEKLKKEIKNMDSLQLSYAELQYLERTELFTPVFIDLLKGFRFDSANVKVGLDGFDLKIIIIGHWYSTILWEVPLMAIISELYFEDDTAWSSAINTKVKQKLIKESGIKVVDFGTRRRFSLENHNIVLDALGDSIIGTSNVRMAMDRGLEVKGTFAHEWIQGIATIYGYRMANEVALEKWAETYKGDLGIALSDTFTTEVFFKSFNMKFAKLYDGVRHDSGDPYKFADQVIVHYKFLGIDPMSKTIVFSDGLTVDEAIKIAKYCEGRIKYSFGIGTSLTNDVGVKPLNMVIKLTGVEAMNDGVWRPAIKLSDEPGKHNGDPEEIKRCKEMLL